MNEDYAVECWLCPISGYCWDDTVAIGDRKGKSAECPIIKAIDLIDHTHTIK